MKYCFCQSGVNGSNYFLTMKYFRTNTLHFSNFLNIDFVLPIWKVHKFFRIRRSSRLIYNIKFVLLKMWWFLRQNVTKFGFNRNLDCLWLKFSKRKHKFVQAKKVQIYYSIYKMCFTFHAGLRFSRNAMSSISI